MTLRAKLARCVLNHAQRHRKGSPTLARACAKYLASYQNHDFHMGRNGEFDVLRRLAPLRPATLFDVGANMGRWSRTAFRLIPEATIHAFEIAPSMAKKLAGKFQDEPRVVVNPFGLSDFAGLQEIDFYLAGGHSGTTMLLNDRVHTHDLTERQVSHVEVGDDYCERHGIDKIDFLKVDVEGAEPRVFAGFERMFTEHRIALVQFEYNSINIGSRFLLRDFFELFHDRDFLVGKLYPHGASFGPYDFREENFRGPNYLAVHRSRPDLRDVLDYQPIRVR